MTKRFIAPLPEWGLIHASGADAATFLHGQLTNDLLHLAAGAAQWNGYCTAKGRMLASFLVWRDDSGGFFLATDKALAPALTKRLRMFVLRAKAAIDDVSAGFVCFGLAHALVDAPTPAASMSVAQRHAGWHLSLPPIDGLERTLAYVPNEGVSGFSGRQPVTEGDASDWTRLMIHAGEAWVTPATQEAFVPQMINFDAIGGINFKKGCYPGQEIVARAHYRGAVKRRMYVAEVDAVASAGDPLFGSAAGGQECGVIALAAPSRAAGSGPDGDAAGTQSANRTSRDTIVTSAVLAVVQMQSQADGEVRLGAPDGPLLRFAALPYAIPEPL